MLERRVDVVDVVETVEMVMDGNEPQLCWQEPWKSLHAVERGSV
jgi:hypothetical protein